MIASTTYQRKERDKNMRIDNDKLAFWESPIWNNHNDFLSSDACVIWHNNIEDKFMNISSKINIKMEQVMIQCLGNLLPLTLSNNEKNNSPPNHQGNHYLTKIKRRSLDTPHVRKFSMVAKNKYLCNSLSLEIKTFSIFLWDGLSFEEW